MYVTIASPASGEASDFNTVFAEDTSGTLSTKAALLSNAQDHSLSGHAPQLSVSKQFIPVLVLAALLLLFFASHLLRYPRVLYIAPRVGGTHLLGNILDEQHDRSSPRKMTITRPMSALRISLSRPKDSKALSHRNISTIYSEPTVRLVQGHTNRSPEPRVYLPEEITLPHSSPTLVGSSSSEFSVSNAEVHVVPPRVYLSPTLPDTFSCVSYGAADQQKDTQVEGDIYTPASTDIRIVDSTSAAQHAMLSSSPPGLAFTGLYNVFNTSTDVHILPTVDGHTSSAALLWDTQTMDNDKAHIRVSPELSPPPLALAHPILVRRALSPWRRRSLTEAPHHVVPANTAVSTAEPGKRHHPSVPSRLRYFITRSASVSLSSSRAHSTPESSLGKRSEKSRIESKPSLVEKIDHVSSRCGTESPGEDDAPRGGSSAVTLLDQTPRTQISLARANTAISDLETLPLDSQLLPEIPGEDTRSEEDQPSFWEPPSPSETSDGSVESRAQSANDAEYGVEQDVIVRPEHALERACARLSTSEMHRKSTGSRSLLGLGLRIRSDPPSIHPPSRPPSIFRSSATSRTPWTEEAAGGAYTSTGPSLRTVLMRWITRRREALHGVSMEADRSFGAQSNVADESVEVMVMNRWAGLDGI